MPRLSNDRLVNAVQESSIGGNNHSDEKKGRASLSCETLPLGPDASRTHDLLLRRQSLYPTELRSHVRHPEYAKEGYMSTSAEPQGKITIKSVFHSVHPGQTALTGAFPFSRLTTAAQFGKKYTRSFGCVFRRISAEALSIAIIRSFL